jgi:hypothetical protein
VKSASEPRASNQKQNDRRTAGGGNNSVSLHQYGPGVLLDVTLISDPDEWVRYFRDFGSIYDSGRRSVLGRLPLSCPKNLFLIICF